MDSERLGIKLVFLLYPPMKSQLLPARTDQRDEYADTTPRSPDGSVLDQQVPVLGCYLDVFQRFENVPEDQKFKY